VLRLGIERSLLKLALSFSLRIRVPFRFLQHGRGKSRTRRDFSGRQNANLRIPLLKIPKGRELTEPGNGSGKLGMFIFLLSIEAFGRTIKI
jgi:hypothetical protein